MPWRLFVNLDAPTRCCRLGITARGGAGAAGATCNSQRPANGCKSACSGISVCALAVSSAAKAATLHSRSRVAAERSFAHYQQRSREQQCAVQRVREQPGRQPVQPLVIPTSKLALARVDQLTHPRQVVRSDLAIIDQLRQSAVTSPAKACFTRPTRERRTSLSLAHARYTYVRPSTRCDTTPFFSSRESNVATVVAASFRRGLQLQHLPSGRLTPCPEDAHEIELQVGEVLNLFAHDRCTRGRFDYGRNTTPVKNRKIPGTALDLWSSPVRPPPENRMTIVTRGTLALLLAVGAQQLSAQVPTPASHFGFEIGADRKLADWTQLTAYYEKLAKSSPRAESSIRSGARRWAAFRDVDGYVAAESCASARAAGHPVASVRPAAE